MVYCTRAKIDSFVTQFHSDPRISTTVPDQAEAETQETNKTEGENKPAFEPLDIGAMFAKRRAEKKAARSVVAGSESAE